MHRLCVYDLGIREEIRQIENGAADRVQNVLKSAPHSLKQICDDEWNKPYSRKIAAYPMVIKITLNEFASNIQLMIYQ